MDQKKVPMRKCVGCGQMKDKCLLLRTVKDSRGTVVFDGRGRMQGRGAYLCADENCFALAKKARRLERAFAVRSCDQAYEAIFKIISEKDK